MQSSKQSRHVTHMAEAKQTPKHFHAQSQNILHNTNRVVFCLSENLLAKSELRQANASHPEKHDMWPTWLKPNTPKHQYANCFHKIFILNQRNAAWTTWGISRWNYSRTATKYAHHTNWYLFYLAWILSLICIYDMLNHYLDKIIEKTQ
jgi:predicted NAD/FAD-binding protein